VNEVNIEAVDLGDKLRKRVEACLNFSPVVLGLPVLGELLRAGKPYALCRVGDRFLLRPLGRAMRLREDR
jgi:hypothetical protein